ncbi:DNA-directed DNA polymerase delta, partial [Friedmanniomyces endolithicus]
MPGVLAQTPVSVPSKRVLQETTRNQLVSPSKKRKLEDLSKPQFKTPAKRALKGNGVGSSQPKSQFEEQILEKLTQDIDALKQKNSERDQHWARPPLDDFNER